VAKSGTAVTTELDRLPAVDPFDNGRVTEIMVQPCLRFSPMTVSRASLGPEAVHPASCLRCPGDLHHLLAFALAQNDTRLPQG